MSRMIAACIALCVLAALIGCSAPRPIPIPMDDEIQACLARVFEQWKDTMTIGALAQLHYVRVGRWPQSLAELKEFASQERAEAEALAVVAAWPDLFDVRWERFKSVTFAEQPDGSLRVECSLVEGNFAPEVRLHLDDAPDVLVVCSPPDSRTGQEGAGNTEDADSPSRPSGRGLRVEDEAREK